VACATARSIDRREVNVAVWRRCIPPQRRKASLNFYQQMKQGQTPHPAPRPNHFLVKYIFPQVHAEVSTLRIVPYPQLPRNTPALGHDVQRLKVRPAGLSRGTTDVLNQFVSITASRLRVTKPSVDSYAERRELASTRAVEHAS
jgi:hypothetical protein